MSDTNARIQGLIDGSPVFLFMKGTPTFPQCGFSASVVNILNTMIPKYTTVNILSDGDIRGGMKEYSDWPTFPQLYVNGELIGGCDIAVELFESGELQKILGAAAATAAASCSVSAWRWSACSPRESGAAGGRPRYASGYGSPSARLPTRWW